MVASHTLQNHVTCLLKVKHWLSPFHSIELDTSPSAAKTSSLLQTKNPYLVSSMIAHLADIQKNHLENLKELTLRYWFNMHCIPGLKHRTSNATSRYPTVDPSPNQLILQHDIASIAASHNSVCSMQSITWDREYIVICQ